MAAEGIQFTHVKRQWVDFSHAERVDRLSFWIPFFGRGEPMTVKFVRLMPDKYQRPLRVVIETKDEPAKIRRLERFLRIILGVDIDVVGELARDTSPLRRLSL